MSAGIPSLAVLCILSVEKLLFVEWTGAIKKVLDARITFRQPYITS
jgi:hypothetical protein